SVTDTSAYITATNNASNDEGIDTTLLAEVVVSHGGGFSFTGFIGTQGQVGASQNSEAITFNSPVAGASLTLTAVSTPTTTVSGSGDSYIPTLLGSNNSFTLGGTPDAAGHTLIALDLSGGANQAAYDNLFSNLPTGASQVADAAAAPIL